MSLRDGGFSKELRKKLKYSIIILIISYSSFIIAQIRDYPAFSA